MRALMNAETEMCTKRMGEDRDISTAGASAPSKPQTKGRVPLVINRLEVSGSVHIGRIIRLLVCQRVQQTLMTNICTLGGRLQRGPLLSHSRRACLSARTAASRSLKSVGFQTFLMVPQISSRRKRLPVQWA